MDQLPATKLKGWTKEGMVKLILIALVNSHPIDDTSMAFGELSALISHSCDPNSCLRVESDKDRAKSFNNCILADHTLSNSHSLY